MMKVDLWNQPYGDDLMVVNAARVSFGKRSEWELRGVRMEGPNLSLKAADKRLIQFLARGMMTEDFEEFFNDVVGWSNDYGWDDERKDAKEQLIDLLWQWRRTPTHFAPFAHPQASFHIKAPIFVARQLAKHQVGMVWSEVSRRYVDDEPEFYRPEFLRKRAENVKQGSSEEPFENQDFLDWMDGINEDAANLYRDMLAGGICAEQARMVLPQSTMTEWIWSGSLYAWANVFNQRTNAHAQRETQEIARQIGNHMEPLFPVSWKALTQC